MQTIPWHSKSVEETKRLLGANSDGLSDEEASERLARYGPNELTERGAKPPLAILASQFTNVMVVVLIVAAIVSGLAGDMADTIVITIILIMNAVLGFVQEYRAEKAMAALKALAVPTVRVTRGGRVREISSRALVPGDILHLETGGQVGADARLVEAVNLRVEEAALTGESVPAEKHVDAVPQENAPLGDRQSMVFAGTSVIYGRGQAVVVNTGMQTELGRIATMIQSVGEKETPLQARLAYLGKWLAGLALGVCIVIFAVGILRGADPKEMFLAAVSLAVAAIPESLPAVITVALALGAQRLVRQRALIRKLPAVETLGCVTTICSDKTGTLTQNKMTVTGIYLDGVTIEVTGSGYEPRGDLRINGRALPEAAPSLASSLDLTLDLTLKGLLLCNDSHLIPPDPESDEAWGIVGDPTEGALVVLAAKAGLDKRTVEESMPRIAEIPFDSDRKRMTTFHRRGDDVISFTKGAVDGTVGLCHSVLCDGQVREMTDSDRLRILAETDKLAAAGQRVLALAFRQWPTVPATPTVENAETDLVYLGLVSMIDPPRPEAANAVTTCVSAGIKPVLITGDHRLTAEAVAREIGILRPGDQTVSGAELDAIDDKTLTERVANISVYSRVSPVHKMRVVEALQENGNIVAMTGDGVNDAPALKRADIGVAMGITGTDVSKEASEMVLADDNFATIVSAVSEGRAIYDNIRKFIRYMLTTNSAETLIVAGAVLSGLPLPLLAIHILWINLVTDGLPALALGFEPAERDVMRRSPRNPAESLFARGMWQHIVWAGIFMAAGTAAVFLWGLATHSLAEARTMVFLTLSGFQVAHVMAIRSERESTFTLGFLSNIHLAGAVTITMVAQFAVVYLPILRPFFHTVPLPPLELAICLLLSSTIFFAVEVEKAWFRRADRRRQLDLSRS